MKVKKNIIFAFLMLISTAMFSQIAGNFDLGIRSDFDDLNSIGVSGTYLYDVDGKLGVGANVGLRFPTASGISGIHIPVLGDVRYYLQGNNQGWYPEVFIGFMHYRHKYKLFNQSYTSAATNFAFGFGAGYKTSKSIDLSARYETTSNSSGTAKGIFGIRLGYWF